MERLPKWCITDRFPALYDVESATTIEQTAKIYGAMNELVDEYNKHAETINNELEKFENGLIADFETYKVAMRQEFQDFIDVIDLKMQDAYNFMKENLRETCQGILDELTKDVQDTLAIITEMRDTVEATLNQQNATIDNQNSLLAGAIKRLDDGLANQNERIDEAVTYMHTNIQETVEAKITQLITDGQIVMGLAHNPDTEELTMHARNVVYDTDLSLSYDAPTETIRINEN